MKSVLYYSNYASLTRGGQKSLFYILRDLDRTKFQPVLVCQEYGELTEKSKELNIPVEIVKVFPFKFNFVLRIFISAIKLYKIIRKYHVEIVHTEEFRVLLLVSVIKFFYKVYIIWHVRVLWDEPLQKKIAQSLADKIIAVSKTVAMSFYLSAKVVIIPNGIDAEEFSPERKYPLEVQLDENYSYVGYIGRIHPEKGLEVLVRSVPLVIKQYEGVKFVIVGNSNRIYRRKLENLIQELNISNNIVFLGEVKDVRGILSEVSIFVLPSLTEGLSRSLLEAMSMARPIVVSDLKQNIELIITGKTGLVAKSGDCKDLAEKILWLLREKEFAKGLGRNAREYAKQYYSLESTMTLIHNLYKTI